MSGEWFHSRMRGIYSLRSSASGITRLLWYWRLRLLNSFLGLFSMLSAWRVQ